MEALKDGVQKKSITQNTNLPNVVKVSEEFIPKDELAIIPYRASKFEGQTFENDSLSLRSRQLAEL